MWVIIDGYNVIRSSGFADDYSFNKLENQRNTFISLLSDYASSSSNRVSVVFDAANTDSLHWTRGQVDGVDVYYSSGGQTADDLIKDLVEGAQNPRDCMVVTSDKEIQYFARSLGASIVSARDLYAKLKKKGGGEEKQETLGEYTERSLKGYEEKPSPNVHKKGSKKKGKKGSRGLNLW